jgi:predicted  nucleic acid-binding Zn-ribbon protein
MKQTLLNYTFVANLKGGLNLQGFTEEQKQFLIDLRLFEEKLDRFQKKIDKHKQKFSLCKTQRDKNRWKKKLLQLRKEFSALEKEKEIFFFRFQEIVDKEGEAG